MSKKQQASWSDFEADNVEFQHEEEELEEVEEVEEEEEEDEKPKAKKKAKAAKEEEEEEEEEEPVKKGKKTEPKSKKKAEPEPDPEEEEEEEEEESEEEENQEEESTEFDPDKFFAQVEKITGQKVEVDYKGVDPTAPEGMALREAAVRQQAVDNLLTEIEEQFPAVFKALNHAYAGGDIAELFRQATERDYSKVTLKEGDDSLAKEILREYYKSKGVKNESKITKMIEADEDSEDGLIKEATSALEEMAKDQAEKRDAIVEEQKRKAGEQQKKDQILITAIDEVLESKKLGNFVIQDKAEVQEFRKFVLSSIRKKEDGKYELAIPLDPSKLDKQLQYQYFQFKQGDLTKVIQQKAATETANRFKQRAQAEQTKQKKSREQESRVAGGSMRDFNIQ